MNPPRSPQRGEVPRYVICRIGPAGNLEPVPIKAATAKRNDPEAFEALLIEMVKAKDKERS